MSASNRGERPFLYRNLNRLWAIFDKLRKRNAKKRIWQWWNCMKYGLHTGSTLSHSGLYSSIYLIIENIYHTVVDANLWLVMSTSTSSNLWRTSGVSSSLSGRTSQYSDRSTSSISSLDLTRSGLDPKNVIGSSDPTDAFPSSRSETTDRVVVSSSSRVFIMLPFSRRSTSSGMSLKEYTLSRLFK